MNDTVTKTVTIAGGAAISTALVIPKTFYLAGITKDDTLDTSVAITFQVSTDGITYFALKGTDAAAISYTVTAASAEAMTFPQSVFYPWEYVKFLVADNQTGITTITCVLRQY